MTARSKPFSADTLKLDVAAEAERIVHWMRSELRNGLRKRGLVLGLSGASIPAFAQRSQHALSGPRGFSAFTCPNAIPIRKASGLGRTSLPHSALSGAIEDIGPMLDAMGCYERRDAFIRQVVPDYGKAGPPRS